MPQEKYMQIQKKMILLLSNDQKRTQKLKKFLLKNGVFSTPRAEDGSLLGIKACILTDCETPSDIPLPCLALQGECDGEILSFIEKTAPELLEVYSYRHLFTGCTKDQVFYLGYPLELTESEFAILRLLTRLGGDAMRGEVISRICSSRGDSDSAALHICSINKKARAVGGRSLIKNDLKKGYFLNKEM